MVYVLASNCSWYYHMVICRRMQWSCLRLSNMAGFWRPCRGAVIKPTMQCLDSVLRLKRLLIRVRMHCKNWVSMADVICTTSCHFGLVAWFNWRIFHLHYSASERPGVLTNSGQALLEHCLTTASHQNAGANALYLIYRLLLLVPLVFDFCPCILAVSFSAQAKWQILFAFI